MVSGSVFSPMGRTAVRAEEERGGVSQGLDDKDVASGSVTHWLCCLGQGPSVYLVLQKQEQCYLHHSAMMRIK